jgi:hypothetical protein
MAHLLSTLRAWPVSADVQAELRAMPEWEQAREWGWVGVGSVDGNWLPKVSNQVREEP